MQIESHTQNKQTTDCEFKTTPLLSFDQIQDFDEGILLYVIIFR